MAELTAGHIGAAPPLLDLFCIDKSLDDLAKEALGRSHPRTPVKSAVHILNLRRVNNVGIGLARFAKRLTDRQVIEAIVGRRASALSQDDLVTLRTLVPASEERQNLLLYSGSLSDLVPAERFMVMASQEPHLLWMLDALIFERQFDGEVDSLSSKFIIVATLLDGSRRRRPSRCFFLTSSSWAT